MMLSDRDLYNLLATSEATQARMINEQPELYEVVKQARQHAEELEVKDD